MAKQPDDQLSDEEFARRRDATVVFGPVADPAGACGERRGRVTRPGPTSSMSTATLSVGGACANCAGGRWKHGPRTKRGSPRSSNSRPIAGRAPNGPPTAAIGSRACWTACEATGKRCGRHAAFPVQQIFATEKRNSIKGFGLLQIF